MLDALLAQLNLGSGPATLKVYDGVQPVSADDALSGNTLLATLTFSDPAASSALGGVLTFDAIAEEPMASASGMATFVRVEDSDGNPVFDGNVGTSDALVTFNTTDVVAGGPVRITSFEISIPASIAF
jgi:hypothetical protein